MTGPLAYGALFVAGVLGGALNSVAGGGSFLVFPTMLWSGVPAVAANATTAVALWPAGLTSVAAYRNELPKDRRALVAFGVASAVGGALGALLLLATSDATFARLVPWLLLVASVVFTFGPRLSKGRTGRLPLAVAVVIQLVISSYGGYFGGGMGILMLATFTLMGMRELHEMNALKVVLSLLINGVALVLFVVSGKVVWGVAIAATLGALAGGWLGASWARAIPARRVRKLVLVVAWTLTAWFFVRPLVVGS